MFLIVFVILLNSFNFCLKLLDLPCINEALKTTDFKTFYKTADICQVSIFQHDF